jgi:hypothetical protein
VLRVVVHPTLREAEPDVLRVNPPSAAQLVAEGLDEALEPYHLLVVRVWDALEAQLLQQCVAVLQVSFIIVPQSAHSGRLTMLVPSE